MEQIKEWYNSLQDSEQRIVLAASLFFGLVIVFFGIIKPINDAVSRLEGQVQSRQNTVSEFKKNMPVLVANRSAARRASNSGGSLSNLVTSSTRQFQLNVSRVQEKSPTEMQVWFDNVAFNDFLRWTAQLENRHQIRIESVNIRNKERNGLTSIDIKLVRN
ncbi:type II secretion system protein M [Aliikangiella marina]|uniref:Type II secretion system protein M n=1 Tax=Aliikangiella marina TaxID=1712262 RepID=A0A545T9P4_9GAMM|nr:type II secretion system protein M [Aliikangiella marina]TQV73927.1 type II secretion system protein M [Aliikangiella marina]